MREIEGFEDAMRVLKPHWAEIECEFQKHNAHFLGLAATDHDVIGRVLRSHLVVESFLNSYLKKNFGFDNFDELRLSFSQKANMLPSSAGSAAFVRPGIIQLNKIRNKFGHTLKHVIKFGEINKITDILSISRPGTVFSVPVEAIEAFAPTACAFLAVPPRHLQDIFFEAFKNINQRPID
ncbi:hypothetical protein [Stappia indica]|uniref:hypothetical protein n=1 Tax=Stappia indica TaxID=538381 RepID=UPI001112A5A4|nr:hypothetical protein [Stappia indica]